MKTYEEKAKQHLKDMRYYIYNPEEDYEDGWANGSHELV